jgi:hypothetical protein
MSSRPSPPTRMNRREALAFLGMSAGLVPAWKGSLDLLAAAGQAGVKDETIHSILVDNSRRFLAFVPKSA